MSRVSLVAAWVVGLGACAAGVVFGVVAVATAVLGEVVIDRAIPAAAFGVAAVVVGLQVLAARRAGVPERYIAADGPGGLVFGAVAVIVALYVTVSLAAGYEQVNGAAVICGFAAALCVRSADLTSQSIRRGQTREPGEDGIMRDTPTAGALHAERQAALELGDDHAAEIIYLRAALLDELPAGFRIERTRADGVPAGRDPGLELGLIDEHYRPERLIGTVHRAVIGRQMIAWSNGRYLEVECAAAHCVMVRFAVLDAERFTTPTTTKAEEHQHEPSQGLAGDSPDRPRGGDVRGGAKRRARGERGAPRAGEASRSEARPSVARGAGGPARSSATTRCPASPGNDRMPVGSAPSLLPAHACSRVWRAFDQLPRSMPAGQVVDQRRRERRKRRRGTLRVRVARLADELLATADVAAVA